MSRNINYTLAEKQLLEAEKVINSSPHPEVQQRAIAIRLLHLGQSPQQIAEGVMVRQVAPSMFGTNGGVARWSPNRSSSES